MSYLMKDIEVLNELYEAIINEGNHPEYHQMIMSRHRFEWPTLWEVLDRIVKTIDEERIAEQLR